MLLNLTSKNYIMGIGDWGLGNREGAPCTRNKRQCQVVYNF